MKSVFVLAVIFSFGLLASAQNDASAVHAPDGGTRQQVMSIIIPAIPNAPFSGTLFTDVTRKLEDGTTVTIQNHRRILRDSSGRIYQERRRLIPRTAGEEPAIVRIEISDPARHIKLFCNPDVQRCRAFPYSSPPAVAASQPVNATGKFTFQRLDLGKNVLDGIEVNGTREITIINPEVVGNDRPIEITKEFWYSTHLGLNVSVRRVDPRFGTESFILKDVSLTEPDPKYFGLPEGYTIEQQRGSLNQADADSAEQ